ncbi:MAG: MlaA family lipoprotein [Hydrotalea sp.]|nr:MlaA family lipoprotein [Hydrotalea sp.]
MKDFGRFLRHLLACLILCLLLQPVLQVANAQTMSQTNNADESPVAPSPLKANFTKPTILPLPASSLFPTPRPAQANASAVVPANPDAKSNIKAPPPIPAKETANTNQQNSYNSSDSDAALSNLFEDAEVAAAPDPNEGRNRQLLDFNIFLDRAFLKPISTVVVAVLPSPVAQIMRNILSNMQEPSKFVFLTLSGHFTDSLLTLSRFTINTTLGIGGAFDPASSFTPALRTKDTSADLMLASWGVPIGDYNVAFFSGPSSKRAGLAGSLESIINPASIALSLLFPAEDSIIRASMLGASATLNRPAALDSIADFADPYAVARSVYWQNYQQREKNYINKK